MSEPIFVSYSHKDNETAKRIIDAVKEASGLSVWYDDDLRGGDHYYGVIADKITECDFFVFILSARSAQSNWCLRELELAASEEKTIVPILLEDLPIPPRVRLVVQNTQYIHYYALSAEDFLTAISRTFTEDAQPANGSSARDEQNLLWNNNTYFLESSTVRKIEGLLIEEKQGKYSVCFKAENAYLLGLAYELGINVKIDLKKAEFYYKVSDHNGSYDGKFLYAAIRRKNDMDGDPSVYLPDMLEAAKHGSVIALTALAEDHYYGINGCKKDLEQAAALWKRAADLGSGAAMYFLAYHYIYEKQVEHDPELAYMYVLMAMEQGFPRAYRLLAYMYRDGGYLEKDMEKALGLFEEAVKHGDYLSLCYAAQIYGREKQNNVRRRELYEQAVQLAEEGKIQSGLPFYWMGHLYINGKEVPQNLEKAVEYYLKAAERKHERALTHAAVSAIRMLPDAEQKEAYLKQALALGCKYAAWELGRMYSTMGLTKEALEYYEKGANAGDEYCAIWLARNYSFVLNPSRPRNREEAVKWFRCLFAAPGKNPILIFKPEYRATVYYAYAMELDYAKEITPAERETILCYYRLSLEASPNLLPDIAEFAVYGLYSPAPANMTPDRIYIDDMFSEDPLRPDIPHTEEILHLLEEHLPAYYRYLMNDDPSGGQNRWNRLVELFKDGYTKLSEHYYQESKARSDDELAEEYKEKALRYEARADWISLMAKEEAPSS